MIFLVSYYIASSQISPDFVRVVSDTLGYDSLRQVLYPSGQLFFQVPYKNGKVNGWYEQYHENGAIAYKQFRINDTIVDGYYVYNSQNGTVSEKGYFKNGHQVGKWYNYYSSGEPSYLVYYNKKGIPVKRMKWISERNKWKRTRVIF